MSRLRARCPSCRTLTAVALADEYECHSCGRTFGAGLVRVPRAWGPRTDALAAAAETPLPYPEAARIEAPSFSEQRLAVAASLPARPLVLGGCCCAHAAAVEALAARPGRLAIVWLDADADLHPPARPPGGDRFRTALRSLLAAGAVATRDCALVGVRRVDPVEAAFLARVALATSLDDLLGRLGSADRLYVALDAAAVAPGQGLPAFRSAPGGLTLEEVHAIFRRIAAVHPPAGAGISGLACRLDDPDPLVRLLGALGL